MKGKEKCRILKEIRAEIARANDIEWVTENCAHKGDCRGTCPKCESEVATLERALARRKAMGKTVAVVGLSAGVVASAASCGLGEPDAALAGDMVLSESTTQSDEVTEVAGGLVSDLTGDETVEVDGGYAPVYYSSDFTPCAEQTYRATEKIYPEELMDVDYSEWTVWEIVAEDEFTVIGESEALAMVLIDFHGQKFALYADYLHFTELIDGESAL